MRMKHRSPLRRSRLLIALFFYSSIVGFTSTEGSTEKTWIDFVAGFGSFTQIITDCNGNILRHDDYPFTDGGISIERTYGVGKVIGKIGFFNVTKTTSFIASNYQESPSDDRSYSSGYVGAAIGLNTPYFGLDAGVLYFNKPHNDYFPITNSQFQPMGKIRIGFEDSWYFSTSLLYNNALISQGGFADMGLGFRFSGTKSSMWLGLGAAPYSDGQFVLRATIAPDFWKAAILFSGNFGLGSNGPEYGLSLGIRLNLQ